MALPKQLTSVPVDGSYSDADAEVIEQLISSGRMSTQAVSDYFNLPVSAIQGVLEKDFGYNNTQLQQALSGIPVEKEYKKGVITVAEQRLIDTGNFRAEPDGSIINKLGNKKDYNPDSERFINVPSPVLKDIPRSGYTQADIDKVVEALRSGKTRITEVANQFDIPMNEVERILQQDYGFTLPEVKAAYSNRPEGSFPTPKATVQAEEQANAQAMIDDINRMDAGVSQSLGQQGLGQQGTGQQGLGQQGTGQQSTGQQGTGQQGTGQQGGFPQNGTISYPDPNVIGGQVNMPQVGVIGAEAALQGGLSGGLAGLQEGLATGATGLTGAVASGLEELRRALGQGRQDITAGYGRAEEGFQPYMSGGQMAQSQLEALTGARGQDAFNQAYQESPYIQFLREQGMRANLAGASATGGLGGGNVQKELARFGQGLASQGLQQQIQNLQQLSGQGLQATQGAGQYAAGGAGQLAGLEQTQGTQALGAMQNVGNQLANLGLAGGQTAAQMGYGTGQSLADIRTRAGELLAGEISNVGRDVSGIASGLGGDISGVYGVQSKNLADLLVQSGMAQADATRISAQLLANVATGASGQVAGLGTSVGQPQQQQGILADLGALAGGLGTGAAGGKAVGLWG